VLTLNAPKKIILAAMLALTLAVGPSPCSPSTRSLCWPAAAAPAAELYGAAGRPFAFEGTGGDDEADRIVGAGCLARRRALRHLPIWLLGRCGYGGDANIRSANCGHVGNRTIILTFLSG
jgi:hypothetical protein